MKRTVTGGFEMLDLYHYYYDHARGDGMMDWSANEVAMLESPLHIDLYIV